MARFVCFHSIDKPEGENPAKIRFCYVKPESLGHSVAGKSPADNTVLIREERKVILDSDGKPMIDKHGRFKQTYGIMAVMIQQEQTG